MAGAAPVAAFVLLAITRGAAAQPPGPADEPLSFADLVNISLFISIFFPVFIVVVVVLAFTCRWWTRRRRRGRASPAWRGWSAGRRGDCGASACVLPGRQAAADRRRVTGGTSCAVCLLEFDDDDAFCLLPTCPHAFHPECIGLWFEMHVTCLLCRANVLDALPPTPPLVQETASPLDSPQTHETVVSIGDASANEEADERIRIQGLARMRRAAERQALPRLNSTGHARAGGMERFALQLPPEHVRLEILMSHRLSR
ncbi:hypothetical protein GUJ93_ZPchr0002g25338 [Zizania palustris]|uniref:RING-type E3 ubiquitin transferase n=1 Tax=Zizania palustris TaxID=103762 RepID=A0A8J5S9U3_ZIZPA|nr:hypothetical protein GUJ93_ZPchr0002g25338 [Zizania palustris]